MESAMVDPAQAVERAALARAAPLRRARGRGDSAVARFYRGAAVLLTGGAGFLGKQLLEKLLRCTEVSKVYLLLRPKKGKSAKERLTQLSNDTVFCSLRVEQPDFQQRIDVVEGDVSQLRMGLSEDDWRKLSDEVSVIFHAAATVNFEEPIRSAVLTNVRGTRELLLLARECRQLQAVVHVSTAFSHATSSRVRRDVLEQFYESPLPPDQLVHLAETLPPEELYEIRKRVGSDWLNTYTFTKAVAEELVRQMAVDLPVCIVRPGIVIAAYQEPTPGWVDEGNVYGPSGMVLGVTLGIIHTMHAAAENVMSFVPVDISNNVALAAACEASSRRGDVKIYTVSNIRNPITWGELIHSMDTDLREVISPEGVWYMCGIYTRHRPLHLLLAALLHGAPALLADAALRLSGNKPRFRKIYSKVNNLSTVLANFTTRDWKFHDDNVAELHGGLSATDKVLFNCDMTSVCNRELIVTWYLGIRKYIIKDGLEGTEYGITKQKRLKVLNFIAMSIYLFVLYKLCVYIVWALILVYKGLMY